jgi:hypothetical protein
MNFSDFTPGDCFVTSFLAMTVFLFGSVLLSKRIDINGTLIASPPGPKLELTRKLTGGRGNPSGLL